MSSEYRTGSGSEAGLAQTKSLEAMNRKTTATQMHELLCAKTSLPKNNSRNGRTANKSVPTRRGRGGKRRGANGPRPTKLYPSEVVERGIPGFRALKYRAKLNYYDVITLTSGAGVAGTYVYSANGMYDPDITSTGHQPMPFDQLMLSFEHYVVVNAKMTISFKSLSTTSTTGIGISLNAGTAATTVYTQLIENGVMVRDRLAQAPYDDSLKVLSMPISISKFGSVRNLLDNPDYSGTIAANPAEQSYFHISIWNPEGVATTSVTAEVFITYDAWFIEPRKNSVSLNAAIRRLILAEEKKG